MIRRAVALVALALALGTSLGLPGRTAADQGATLRIDPPSTTVDGGETFTVSVIQNASIATTGAQITFVFDPKVVQVLDMQPGPSYAGGLFLFGSADDGTSESPEAAVANANQTGALKNVATFLLPGSGSVPPGDAVIVTLALQGTKGAGGSTGLSLQQSAVVDEGGNELPSTAIRSEVTVRASSEPAVGATSTAAPTATPTPTATPLGAGGSGAPGPTGAPAAVTATPPSLTLTAGASAVVKLVMTTDRPASSVVASLAFDQEVLEITEIATGRAWRRGILLAGDQGTTVEDAIAAANASGVLAHVGVFIVPGVTELPSGEGHFLSVRVRARTDGTSSLTVTDAAVLDAQGNEIPLSPASIAPAPSPGTGGGVDPLLAFALALALAIVVGIVLVRTGVVTLPAAPRRWPFAVALLLGMIPVVMLASMVAMLVASSLPALGDPGLAGLAGSEFSSKYSGTNLNLFGLQPALVGTLLITAIAIAIALPVSLALAVVSTEFPMGPVGRVVSPLVGLLSGIPPIVYAVSVLVFISLFMVPKFAADSAFATFDPTRLGVQPQDWPPQDVPFTAGSLPWDLTGTNNSTLLGGILIALLVIPFMTPLITDAMRNVPSGAREASFALGANRGYTLRKVILPLAMPGIVAALALGMLKALGDTLIVAFAVGWQADTIPNPIVDVLERTPSLAAQGAGLVGSFPTIGATCTATQCAVGYSSALLLLALAVAVVVSMSMLQARLRRRMAA